MKTKIIQSSLIAILFCIAPLTANATLGENTSSIMNDTLAFKASATQSAQSSEFQKTISSSAYQTNSITTANGIVIKEFSYNNKVFAISWSGKKVPDQNQLYGRYFTTLTNSAPSYKSLNVRKVTSDDFISSTSGWMGHYSGVAFIPSLAPTGVTIDSLNKGV